MAIGNWQLAENRLFWPLTVGLNILANTSGCAAPLGLETLSYHLPTSSDMGSIIPRLWRSTVILPGTAHAFA